MDIKARGFQLAQILDRKRGEIELICSHIDLEQKLETAQKKLANGLAGAENVLDIGSTIEVAEFADENGRLRDQYIPEHIWMDTIKDGTDLDVRAILSDLPKELGLCHIKFAYKADNKILLGLVKLMVVPVLEE